MRNQSRCKNCYYSANKAVQEPCDKCKEIHYKHFNYDDKFLDKEKDLMKEC